MSKNKRDFVMGHLSDYFRGIGQALFFPNSFFGFAFLACSLYFKPFLFTIGFVASLVAYIHSVVYATPNYLKQTGLMTINGFFFGVGFAILFEPNPFFYAYLGLGALAIPMVTKAFYELLQHWKLSPLIFPYLLAIWTFWLGASELGLVAKDLSAQAMSQVGLELATSSESARFVVSSLENVGQIFFIRDFKYGFFVCLLVAAFDLRRAAYLAIGAAVAAVVFAQVSSDELLRDQMLFSGSAALVALGLASLPDRYPLSSVVLFCVVSLFVTIAMARLFRVPGLPILSLPFVLTFWCAILGRSPRLNLTWSPVEVRVK